MKPKPSSLVRIAARHPELRGAISAYYNSRGKKANSRKIRLSPAEHKQFEQEVLERNKTFPFQGKQVPYRALPEHERERVRAQFQNRLRNEAKNRVRQRIQQTGAWEASRKTKIVSPDLFRMTPSGEYRHDPQEQHEVWNQSYSLLDNLLSQDDTQGVVAMIGIPGAGKSTWLKGNKEPGWVYFDATLSTPRGRKDFIEKARRHGKPIKAVHIDTPLQISLAQNATRSPDRKVPEQVLQQMYANLLTNPPRQEEGFAGIQTVKRKVGSGTTPYTPSFEEWVAQIESQQGGFTNPRSPADRKKDRVKYKSLSTQDQAKIRAQYDARFEQQKTPLVTQTPHIEQSSAPSNSRKQRLMRDYQMYFSDHFYRPQSLEAELPKEDLQNSNFEIARKGRVVDWDFLSEGETEKGINVSIKLDLDHSGKRQSFVFKPSQDEFDNVRHGMRAGGGHQNEAAAYQTAKNLGFSVIPDTLTRGDSHGSFQVFDSDAKMFGDNREDLAKVVSASDLNRVPQFEELNFFDLMFGNQDRHGNNLMYKFEGDQTPENLRLVAIDNGLGLASPQSYSGDYMFQHPFKGLVENPNSSKEWDKAMGAADENIKEALSNPSTSMVKKIKDTDINKLAKDLASTGINSPKALTAALVRVVALQEKPDLFKSLLDEQYDDLPDAWKEFQYLSGIDKSDSTDDIESMGHKLLKKAGATHRKKDILQALKKAFPGFPKGKDGIDYRYLGPSQAPASSSGGSDLKTKDLEENITTRMTKDLKRAAIAKYLRKIPL